MTNSKLDPTFDSTEGLAGLQALEASMATIKPIVNTNPLTDTQIKLARRNLVNNYSESVLSIPDVQYIGNKYPDVGRSTYDYNITDESQLEDINAFRAGEQSWLLKGTNAVIGGVVGALGTMTADLSYMADFENYKALFNDVDTLEDNWLAKIGNKWRSDVYEAFPIYETEGKNTLDKFAKFSTVRGMLDSAVGFMVPGAIVTKGVSKAIGLGMDAVRAAKAANMANKVLNAEKKAAYIASLSEDAVKLAQSRNYTNYATSILSGAITNQAEGVMMATQEYDNIKNRYIEDRAAKIIQSKYLINNTPEGSEIDLSRLKDIPKEEFDKAKEVAEQEFKSNKDLQLEIAKKQGDFVLQNRLFMLTDAIALHGLVKASKLATREGMKLYKGLLQSLGSFSTDNLIIQGLTEGVEEVGQNAFQMELGYQVGEKFDFQTPEQEVENNKDFFTRLKDFALTDESLVQGLMGLVSGGAQRAFTEFAVNSMNGDPLGKEKKKAYEDAYNKQQELKNSYTKSKLQKMATLTELKGKNNENTVGGKVKADLLRNSGFYNTLTEAFMNGTTEDLENSIKAMSVMTDEEATASNFVTQAQEDEARSKGDFLTKSYKTIAEEWLKTLKTQEAAYNILSNYHDSGKLLELDLNIKNHSESLQTLDSQISEIKSSPLYQQTEIAEENLPKIIEDKLAAIEREKQVALSKASDKNKAYVEQIFETKKQVARDYSHNSYYEAAYGKELIELEEAKKSVQQNIKDYTQEFTKISSPKYQLSYNKNRKEILAARSKFEADYKAKQDKIVLDYSDYVDEQLKDLPKEVKQKVVKDAIQKAKDDGNITTQKALEEVEARSKEKPQVSNVEEDINYITNKLAHKYRGLSVDVKNMNVIQHILDNKDTSTLEELRDQIITNFAPEYGVKDSKVSYEGTAALDAINMINRLIGNKKPMIEEAIGEIEEDIQDKEVSKTTITEETFKPDERKKYLGNIAGKVAYRARKYLTKAGIKYNAGNQFERFHNVTNDPTVVKPGTTIKYKLAPFTQEVSEGGKIVTWKEKLARILSTLGTPTENLAQSIMSKGFSGLTSLDENGQKAFKEIIRTTPIEILAETANGLVQIGYIGEAFSKTDAEQEQLYNQRLQLLQSIGEDGLSSLTSTITSVNNGELSVNSDIEGNIVFAETSTIKNPEARILILKNTKLGPKIHGRTSTKVIENADKIQTGYPYIEVPINETTSRAIPLFRKELNELPLYKNSVINAIKIFNKLQTTGAESLTSEEQTFILKIKELAKSFTTFDRTLSFDISTIKGLKNYLKLFIHITETDGKANLLKTLQSKTIKDSRYRAITISDISTDKTPGLYRIELSDGKNLNIEFKSGLNKGNRFTITGSEEELYAGLEEAIGLMQFNVDTTYMQRKAEGTAKSSFSLPLYSGTSVVSNTYTSYDNYLKYNLETNILENEFTDSQGQQRFSYVEQRQILFSNPKVGTKIGENSVTIPVETSVEQPAMVGTLIELTQAEKDIEYFNSLPLDIARQQSEFSSYFENLKEGSTEKYKRKQIIKKINSKYDTLKVLKVEEEETNIQTLEEKIAVLEKKKTDDIAKALKIKTDAQKAIRNKAKKDASTPEKIIFSEKKRSSFNVNSAGLIFRKAGDNYKTLGMTEKEGEILMNKLLDLAQGTGAMNSYAIGAFMALDKLAETNPKIKQLINEIQVEYKIVEEEKEVISKESDEIIKNRLTTEDDIFNIERNKAIVEYEKAVRLLKAEFAREETKIPISTEITAERKAELKKANSSFLNGLKAMSDKQKEGDNTFASIDFENEVAIGALDNMISDAIKSVEGFKLITSNTDIISSTHQRQFIRYIVDTITSNILTALKDKSSNVEVTSDSIRGMLNDFKDIFTISLEEYADPNTTIGKHLTEYLAKWKNVEHVVLQEIQHISGVRTREGIETDEYEFEETESILDKNTYDDNFNLTLDHNNISSTRMRLALNGLKNGEDKFYLDGVSDMPVRATDVINIINSLLADTTPSYEIMKTRLLERADIYVWITDLVEKLENDEILRKEFVKNMHKYTVRMTKTIINSEGKVSVIDSNSNSVYYGTLRDWNTRFINSSLIIRDEVTALNKVEEKSKEYLNSIIGDWDQPNTIKGLVNELAHIKTPNEETVIKQQQLKEKLKEFLLLLNIGLSEPILNKIIEGQYKLYPTDKQSTSTYDLFNGSNSLFGQIIYRINEGVDVNKMFAGALIKSLIQQDSAYSVVVNVSSFMSGDKIVSGFSFPKAVTERTIELNPKDGTTNTLIDDLLTVPFCKSSRLLQGLKLDLSAYRQSMELSHLDLSPFGDSNAKGRPLEYHQLPKRMQHMIRLSHFYNNGQKVDGVRIAKAFYLTMSDKKSLMTITTPVVDLPLLDEESLLDTLFDSLIQPEIDRMQAWAESVNRGKLVNLKNFNEGANIFYRVPELNDITIEVDGETIPVMIEPSLEFRKKLEALDAKIAGRIQKIANPLLWGDDSINAKEVLMIVMKNKFSETMQYVVDSQIKEWQKSGIGIIEDVLTNIPQEAIDFVKTAYGVKTNEDILLAIASDYALNTWMLNGEFEQLYTGDPATAFNNKAHKAKTFTGKVYETILNRSKRLACDNANGYMGDTTTDVSLNIVAVNDIKRSSEVLDYYDRIGLDKGSIAEQTENESTDGGALMSLNEYLRLMRINGKITEATEKEILANYKKGPLGQDDLNIILNPLKPVYGGNRIIDGWVDSRTFIKFAAIPLLKQFTNGFEIDKLRRILDDSNDSSIRENQIDMITFDSTIKQGLPANSLNILDRGSNTFKNLDQFHSGNITQLPRKDFRIQLDKPFDESHHEISVGTQALSAIFSAVRSIKGDVFNYHGKDISVEELEKEFVDLHSKRYERGLQSLKETLVDKNGNVDIIKLKDIIYKEGLARGYSLNTLLGLELAEDGKTFKTPIWAMGENEKIEALLMSIVKNRIVKLKHQGIGGILGTSVGVWENLEDAEVPTAHTMSTTPSFTGKLLGRRFDEKGNVLPAQILMASTLSDALGNTVDIYSLIDKFATKTTDGRLIIDAEKLNQILPKEYLEGFTFRIPTQGYSSMSMVEVVGFLPKNYGYTMLVPVDFIKQMGIDFDIDTNYTYLYKTAMVYDKELHTNKFIRMDKLTDDQIYWTAFEKIKRGLIKENKVFGEYSRQDLLFYIETNRNEEFKEAREEIKDNREEAILQNNILDIYLSVSKCTAEDNKVQKLFSKLLDYGNMSDDESGHLAKTIDEWRKAKSTTTEKLVPLSGQFQFDSYNRANMSKGGIGAFATILGFLNDITDRYDNPLKFEYNLRFGNNLVNMFKITIDGNTSDGTIGKSSFFDKVHPLENLSSFLSVMVDEEKLRAAARLNINDYTIPTIVGLVALGYSIEQILYVINQDVIHDYIEALDRKRGLASTEVNIKEVDMGILNGLLKTEYADIIDIPTSFNLTTDGLIGGLKGTQDDLTNLKIASVFFQASLVGNEMFKLRKRTNMSSKGLPSTILENIQLQEDIKDVVFGKYGTNLHGVIRHASQLYGTVTDGQFVPNTIAGHIFDKGVTTAANMFNKQFPYNTPVYKKTYQAILYALTGKTSSNVVDKSANLQGLNKVIFRHIKAFLNTIQGVMGTMDVNAERANLLLDDKTTYTMKIAKPFTKQFTELTKKVYQSDQVSLGSIVRYLYTNPYYQDNEFLRSIRVVDDADGIPMITFNNTTGNRINEDEIFIGFFNLLTDNKDLIINIPRVFTNDKGEQTYIPKYNITVNTRDLAIKFIKNMLLTNNTNKARNYNAYVPTTLLNVFGIGEALNNFDWDNSAKFVDMISTQIIQHMSKRLSTIVKVPKFTGVKDIGTFMADKGINKLQLANLDGTPVVYSFRPDATSTTFQIINSSTLPTVDSPIEYKPYVVLAHDNTELLYKFIKGEYKYIPMLGNGTITEFNATLETDYTQDSILPSNHKELKPDSFAYEIPGQNLIVTNNDNREMVGDIMNLLEEISTNSSTPFNKVLAERMLQMGVFNNLKVFFKDKLFVNGLESAGAYNAETQELFLKKKLSSTSLESTILHEMLHHILVSAVKHPTDAQKPYVDRLNKLLDFYNKTVTLEELQKYFPLAKAEILQASLIDELQHPTKGIHEFLAQAMSSQRFRDYLQSKGLIERVYQYILEIINKAFNIQIGEINLLNSIESNIFAIMDNSIESSSNMFRTEPSSETLLTTIKTSAESSKNMNEMLDKMLSSSSQQQAIETTALNYYEGYIKPDSNTVFVFGSNPQGRHGAGAAKIAKEQFGAKYGQGEGLQGNSYALPTKDLRVRENNGFKSISPEQIIESIKKLYNVSRQNSNKQFKIAYTNTTRTSLNGYTGLEMIEMFKAAGTIPSNVIFSKEWIDTGKLNTTAQPTTSLPSPDIKINIYAGTGENIELSNFANRPFVYKGIKYNTVEGAFQAAKLDYTDESQSFSDEDVDVNEYKQGFSELSGNLARQQGKSIKGLDRGAWDYNSSRVMKELLVESFKQNPDALQRLLATGSVVLTHTQDKGKWGIEFPKLLMEVREELAKTTSLASVVLDKNILNTIEETAKWQDKNCK